MSSTGGIGGGGQSQYVYLQQGDDTLGVVLLSKTVLSAIQGSEIELEVGQQTGQTYTALTKISMQLKKP